MPVDEVTYMGHLSFLLACALLEALSGDIIPLDVFHNPRLYDVHSALLDDRRMPSEEPSDVTFVTEDQPLSHDAGYAAYIGSIRRKVGMYVKTYQSFCKVNGSVDYTAMNIESTRDSRYWDFESLELYCKMFKTMVCHVLYIMKHSITKSLESSIHKEKPNFQRLKLFCDIVQSDFIFYMNAAHTCLSECFEDQDYNYLLNHCQSMPRFLYLFYNAYTDALETFRRLDALPDMSSCLSLNFSRIDKEISINQMRLRNIAKCQLINTLYESQLRMTTDTVSDRRVCSMCDDILEVIKICHHSRSWYILGLEMATRWAPKERFENEVHYMRESWEPDFSDSDSDSDTTD